MHKIHEMAKWLWLPSTRIRKEKSVVIIIIIIIMLVVTDILIVISFSLFISLFMFCRGHTENIATDFLSSLDSRFALTMAHCSLCDIFHCCLLQSKYLA